MDFETLVDEILEERKQEETVEAELKRLKYLKDFHYTMWDYIIKNIDENPCIGNIKSEFLKKYGPRRKIRNECFACEAATADNKLDCTKCPVFDEVTKCGGKDSLYSKAFDARDNQLKIEYCTIIRDSWR